MKQLSKLESAIFLLGGVLMVVGAACFAFGFSHPQLVQVTSWGFLLGTILFSVMQAMQFYEGPSLVIHRLKRMQYVADIFFSCGLYPSSWTCFRQVETGHGNT